MNETQSTSLSERWIRRQAIAGDASHRVYHRLWDEEERTAVLAIYPANAGPELRRDLEVLRWCRSQGLRVPRLVTSEPAHFRVVLEDFGIDDAESALRALPADARTSYSVRLIEPLKALSTISPAALPAWNPPLGRERLRWELAGFELWFVAHGCGRSPSTTTSWLDELANEIASHPTRVCHRDFHLNNLFFLPDDEVGMIDFQDILVGPDTYDAVSLMAERAMPALIGQAQLAAWQERWARACRISPGWRQRWPLVQVQRGLKVLGTFARLVASGRQQYIPWTEELAASLQSPLQSVDAPAELLDCLLNWCESGGPYVR